MTVSGPEFVNAVKMVREKMRLIGSWMHNRQAAFANDCHQASGESPRIAEDIAILSGNCMDGCMQ
jgi:hypothetical protein